LTSCRSDEVPSAVHESEACISEQDQAAAQFESGKLSALEEEYLYFGSYGDATLEATAKHAGRASSAYEEERSAFCDSEDEYAASCSSNASQSDELPTRSLNRREEEYLTSSGREEDYHYLAATRSD